MHCKPVSCQCNIFLKKFHTTYKRKLVLLLKLLIFKIRIYNSDKEEKMQFIKWVDQSGLPFAFSHFCHSFDPYGANPVGYCLQLKLWSEGSNGFHKRSTSVRSNQKVQHDHRTKHGSVHNQIPTHQISPTLKPYQNGDHYTSPTTAHFDERFSVCLICIYTFQLFYLIYIEAYTARMNRSP